MDDLLLASTGLCIGFSIGYLLSLCLHKEGGRTSLHITPKDLSVARPGDLLIIKTLEPLSKEQYGFAVRKIAELSASSPDVEIVVLDATTDLVIIPGGASTQ